jgi:hypothetical protein
VLQTGFLLEFEESSHSEKPLGNILAIVGAGSDL